MVKGKVPDVDIGVWGVGPQGKGHQNSSSIILRNAQQVQGPCRVDPEPPGRPQAGFRVWIKNCLNRVLLKRDKPIFMNPKL